MSMEAFSDEMAREEFDKARVYWTSDLEVWLASWHCLRDKFATLVHCHCPLHKFSTNDLYAFWDHLKTHNFEEAGK